MYAWRSRTRALSWAASRSLTLAYSAAGARLGDAPTARMASARIPPKGVADKFKCEALLMKGSSSLSVRLDAGPGHPPDQPRTGPARDGQAWGAATWTFTPAVR